MTKDKTCDIVASSVVRYRKGASQKLERLERSTGHGSRSVRHTLRSNYGRSDRTVPTERERSGMVHRMVQWNAGTVQWNG